MYIYILEHYHIEECNLSFSSVFLIAKCFKAVPLINLSAFTSDRNRFFNILCTLSILYEILTCLKRKRYYYICNISCVTPTDVNQNLVLTCAINTRKEDVIFFKYYQGLS